MIRIIESSEIISYIIVKQIPVRPTLKLPFCKIRAYARSLESQRGDIRVECDLMSIDAFRCSFKGYITIENDDLYIYDLPALRPKVQRYMPSDDITMVLNTLSL